MRWWRAQSLRSRLVIASSFVSVLVSLAVAFLVFWAMSGQLIRVTDSTLGERAFELANRARAGDPDAVRTDQFAQLLDADGTVLASSPAVPEGFVLFDVNGAGFPEDGYPIATTTRIPDVSFRLRSLARVVDGPNGDFRMVVAATDLTAVDAGRRQLLVWLAIGTPLGALAISVVGWMLIRRVLAPVRRMSQRASSIDPATDRIELESPTGTDEFAELGDAFNGLLERIDSARTRERGFIADVSHELRTPFSILRGELELARLDGVPPDLDRTLTSAIEEIDRMVALTQRLLFSARSEAGQMTVAVALTDLNALVNRMLSSLPREGTEAIAVDASLVTPAPVMVDPDLITQVLINVVMNALSHARSTVHIIATHDDAALEIVVADDGPGFAREMTGGDFARFHRGPGERAGTARPGFGLGLSIVATLVDACAGTVAATNNTALGGACVTIRVPAAPLEVARTFSSHV